MIHYLYDCRVHGELEIEHRITEDRKARACPKGCGETLKPLISSGGAHKDHPAVFRGGGWEFKDQPQYKEYHVTTTRDDPLGTRAAKERRDPAAVR
jgi:hypothetical protein